MKHFNATAKRIDAGHIVIGTKHRKDQDIKNSRTVVVLAMILAVIGTAPYVFAQGVVRATNKSQSTLDAENQYWQKRYSTRPYYDRNVDYSNYSPAYQYGVAAYTRYNGMRFDDLDQAQLQRGWELSHGASTLTWDQAREAFQDSYDRLYNNHTVITGSNATIPSGVGSNADAAVNTAVLENASSTNAANTNTTTTITNPNLVSDHTITNPNIVGTTATTTTQNNTSPTAVIGSASTNTGGTNTVANDSTTTANRVNAIDPQAANRDAIRSAPVFANRPTPVNPTDITSPSTSPSPGATTGRTTASGNPISGAPANAPTPVNAAAPAAGGGAKK